MRTIALEDLRYGLENEFAERIKPKLARLIEAYPEIQNKQLQRERHFFHLLSTSIRIDTYPMVKGIVETIRGIYKLDIPVLVFVYQDHYPKAMCSSYLTPGDNPVKELIILISQHFFNQLDYQERTAIIAHEVCHYLLGHLEIPAAVILSEKIKLKDALGIRTPLLKWSVCAELSSDITAMLANDMRPKVFSNSIIKFSSGITALDSYDLIGMLLWQYDAIARDDKSSQLTPHPILPLRIKVAWAAAETRLAKHFGKTVSDEEFESYKKEYDDTISECIRAVYPEITQSGFALPPETMLDLALAVGYADHELTKTEIRIINTSLGSSLVLEKHLSEIGFKDLMEPEEINSLIQILLDRSIQEAKNLALERHDLLAVLRFMLLISASDDEVALEELNVIYRFFKEFNFSRHDIVMNLEQLHLNAYAEC